MNEIEELLPALVFVSGSVSSYLVASTPLPANAHVPIAALLFAAGIAVPVAVYRATGLETSGGRCRALTNDGDRCQHPRRANEDLCRAVHQPMYERGSHVRLVEVADEPE